MKYKNANIIAKIMRSVAAMTFTVAVLSATNTCVFWSYQPAVPDELYNWVNG